VVGSDHVVADLAEVVGGAQVRRSASDVTVFESVGIAFEDLVVARAAVDRRG
jgi:ornithine cyclodeaminase/alanine dehydrogenase-like protein (mu-crystallin family)